MYMAILHHKKSREKQTLNKTLKIMGQNSEKNIIKWVFEFWRDEVQMYANADTL